MAEQHDVQKIKEEADKYRKVLSQLSDSPETISSLISMLCLTDLKLRDALRDKGMTSELLDEIKQKITHIYRTFLDRTPPDLSWMDTVEFKFLTNTEKEYTIPLPHMG